MVTDLTQLNDLSYKILGCAYTVHTKIGPGLLESAYQACLKYELLNIGLSIKSQYPVPLVYNEVEMGVGYRLDLMVEDSIVIEIKSVESILPIHKAQLMTYLKLTGVKLGLLLNFNVVSMKQGVTRIVM